MKLSLASGSFVLALLLSACAASTPPPRTDATTTTSADAPVTSCEVHCEGAKVIAQPGESPDYHAIAEANAQRTFAAMESDLLACYKQRLVADPGAHAFLTIDTVIEPDGRVRSVTTSGGARLGTRTLRCIVDRVQQAAFEPISGGGTRRIQVPFTFRRVAPDET